MTVSSLNFKEEINGIVVELKKKELPNSRIVRGKEYPVGFDIVVNSQNQLEKETEAIAQLFGKLSKQGVIKQLLNDHGVLIFEGLPTNDPEAYSQIVNSAFENNNHIPYDMAGVLGPARSDVARNVVTVNGGASDIRSSAHQEFSRFKDFPTVLTFFAQHSNPEIGGDSLTAHATELFDRVQEKYPQFIEDLKQKGLYLVQTWPYSENDPNGSWIAKYAFGKTIEKTDSLDVKKEKAAKIVRDRVSDDFEFLDDHGIKIHQHTQPLRVHPHTQLPIFFSSLPAYYAPFHRLKQTKTAEEIKSEGLTPNINYDNGEPIPDEYLEFVYNTAVDIEYVHPYKNGDFIFLDNYSVYHGRNPFTGGREILASFWDEPEDVKLKPDIFKP